MKHYSNIFNECQHGGARAMLTATGLSMGDIRKRAFVGVHSTGYSGNPCNMKLNYMADLIKKQLDEHHSDELHGFRYNSLGVSDGITMGTNGMRHSLASRDKIKDTVFTVPDAHSYDANISVTGCDKNMPGACMGLSELDRPSLIVYGGSIMPGYHRNKPVDIVTAFQSFGELVVGHIDESEREELLTRCCPGAGACGGMYTANTMAVALEAMGMIVPYGSSNMAESPEKIEELRQVPNHIYNLLRNNIKPSDIITSDSIKNAIVTAIAMGGSTNMVLHFLAIARTAGIELDITDFNRIGKTVPVFGNLKPFGEYVMYDMYRMGGTPVILRWLLDAGYLIPGCMTVTGKTNDENLDHVDPAKVDTDIFRINNPIRLSSHIRIFNGNLSPGGCVGKITGKEGEEFSGTALTYNREQDFILDLAKGNINSGNVIVIRYQGPKGGPGMPEMLESTSAAAGYGLINDIAMITDGRFSGGSHGFIIGHVTPEAYLGGPIALVRDGDEIIINAVTNQINILISDEELAIRAKEWILPSVNNNITHTLKTYRKLVSSASDGCIVDIESLGNI